jgi:hypothetical protein
MTPDQVQWWCTIDAAIEELYLCLMKEKDDLYYKQAYVLMRLIPIERPPPVYEIKISDLNEQVKKESDDRWEHKDEIDHILREAVGKVFENINQEYFFKSVKRLLKVRLV